MTSALVHICCWEGGLSFDDLCADLTCYISVRWQDAQIHELDTLKIGQLETLYLCILETQDNAHNRFTFILPKPASKEVEGPHAPGPSVMPRMKTRIVVYQSLSKALAKSAMNDRPGGSGPSMPTGHLHPKQVGSSSTASALSRPPNVSHYTLPQVHPRGLLHLSDHRRYAVRNTNAEVLDMQVLPSLTLRCAEIARAVVHTTLIAQLADDKMQVDEPSRTADTILVHNLGGAAR